MPDLNVSRRSLRGTALRGAALPLVRGVVQQSVVYAEFRDHVGLKGLRAGLPEGLG